MGWEEEGRQYLKVHKYTRGPYRMGSSSRDSRNRIAGRSVPISGNLMSEEMKETGVPELRGWGQCRA